MLRNLSKRLFSLRRVNQFTKSQLKSSLRTNNQLNSRFDLQPRQLRKPNRYQISDSDLSRPIKMLEYKNKQVFVFGGEEMESVFQSICSADVSAFFRGQYWQSLHSLVLSNDGRVRIELFLVKPSKVETSNKKLGIRMTNEELFVIVNKKDRDDFLKIIRRYSFKRKIKMEDITNTFKVTRFWNVPLIFSIDRDQRGCLLGDFYNGIDASKLTAGSYIDTCSYDPRDPNLGIFYTHKKSSESTYFLFNYISGDFLSVF